MAGWISHLMVVDRLYAMGIDLDERGFAVGNIAPDCNVENEDWTQFTPPREVTHWMNGKSKLTADYEGFYEAYIKDKAFASREHEAFLWGYYSHLVTDVAFQRFVRDEKRVADIYLRLAQNEEMYGKVSGYPEDFDTLKRVFGRKAIFEDIILQESRYLEDNPNARFNTVLRKVRDFPDYIDYLPPGAIARKIGVMAREETPGQNAASGIFFTQDEYCGFVENTSGMTYRLMQEKRYRA